MKDHLFISSLDGALHDTRTFGWTSRPLRENFSIHHVDIKTLADLKATLRAGSTTDLGGYPLYLIDADGEAVSFDGALANWAMTIWDMLARTSSRIVACHVNYEDTDLYCRVTGKPIPSAYGTDDEQQEGDADMI